MVLSGEELYLLAGLLQTGTLIGIRDPFPGLLADEMEERLEQAKKSLSDQGVLKERPGKELIIDSGVAVVVRAITSANHLLVAVLSLDHHTSHLLIHSASDIAVEQAVLPSGDIALTAVRDAQALKERLEDFFGLSEATETTVLASRLALSEADFAQVQHLAQERDDRALRDLLRHKGVPPETISALAAALGEGQQVISIAVLHRSAQEMRYGETLAWLVGGQGAWQVQSLEQDQAGAVCLTPTTTAEIKQRIAQMVATLYQGVNA